MTQRPWDLVHRGQVTAHGLLLDAGVLGEREVERRILAHWRPGDQVERSPSGTELPGDQWVLRFADPRTLPDPPPGLALVRREGVLTAVPLRDPEWTARPTGPVLQAQGGVLVERSDAKAVDPSAWIAVDAPVLPVRPLRAPPPPLRAAVRAAPVGEEFAGFGDAAAVAAVRQAVARSVPPDPEPAPAEASSPWLDRVRRWVDVTAKDPEPAPGAPPEGPAAVAPGGGFGDFLERTFARALLGMGLGGAVDRQHQSTLESLLERFERDLDDALRHAIPLGGTASDGSAPWHPSLRAPKPRSSLSPSLASPGGVGASTTYGAKDGMYEAIREAYRAAARQLEEAGDFEKAAFVHTDLLGDVLGAVDLLERNGRFALAAQLWEARSTASRERLVRLWFLAGDPARAARLAHVHQVFGPAIARLDDRPEAQHVLRAAWAAHLVASGHLAAAADAVWPDDRLRKTALPWLRALVDRGGEPAVDALLRLATLDLAAATQALHARLTSPHPDDRRLRQQLASRFPPTGPLEWSRPLARQLLIDADPGGWDGFKHLSTRPENADLRVDAPTFPLPKAPDREAVLRGERGTSAILDAVLLPHGTLCALGEAGLTFLDRDGRVVWRDPTPADHLVADPDSVRLLALSGIPGRAMRITRVDTGTLAATPWTWLPLVAWARTSAAGRWAVSDPDRDRVLDISAPEPTWVWEGPDRQGRAVRAIFAGPDAGTHVICIARTDPHELWRYDATMHWRRQDGYEPGSPLVVHGQQVLSATPGAGPVWTRAGVSRVVELPDAPRWGGQAVYDGAPLTLDLCDELAVIARSIPEGARVDVFTPDGARTLTFRTDAERVRVRAAPGAVLVFDDQGRVWEIALPTGQIRRTGWC